MKQLSKPAYEKAVAALQATARPLERARYARHFSGGSAADVVTALQAFQNPDGGFGHGLEPDIRLPASSVIATTVAFQHFRELRLAADHPLVASGCRYLLQTYDAAQINWSNIPASIDDAPHAPWWAAPDDPFTNRSNPRAEIAGYLNDYPEHFPAAMQQAVTASVIDHLVQQPDTLEMHDLLCYIRLWETESLPPDTRAALFVKLKRVVDVTVERNPAGWRAYGLPPLSIIRTPDSPFAEGCRAEIEQNLDFVIDAQGEDGLWSPNWSWGDQWPDAWEQAQREWSGRMTVDNLVLLAAFGRIAG
jgi:hypothetical protein